MRKRMKKIAMLLSAAMLINSMDGAVMVSATDMTEVIEESTGVAEESIEEDSEDISADDETGEGEADLQDEEIILEEAAGETEDEEFIIEEQEDIWFDCIDRRKWDTFDTVCMKKYLND